MNILDENTRNERENKTPKPREQIICDSVETKRSAWIFFLTTSIQTLTFFHDSSFDIEVIFVLFVDVLFYTKYRMRELSKLIVLHEQTQ